MAIHSGVILAQSLPTRSRYSFVRPLPYEWKVVGKAIDHLLSRTGSAVPKGAIRLPQKLR